MMPLRIVEVTSPPERAENFGHADTDVSVAGREENTVVRARI